MDDTRWSSNVISFKATILKASVSNQPIEEERNLLGPQGLEPISTRSAQEPLQPICSVIKGRS